MAKIFELTSAKKIYVSGHRGLVGSALVRALEKRGLKEKLLLRTHKELDLVDQRAVKDFFKSEKPDVVIIAAALVGGIQANATYPVEFLYENLMIEMNTIHAAAENETQKLLFLGSSCIYPKMAPQTIKESSLLTSALETTNEAYALSKIAGLKLCQYYFKQYGKSFISAMPTNLYGPFDNFHPENSHVIPALMRRFHFAKMAKDPSLKVWGTGKPYREFLHVDDLAEGSLALIENWNQDQWVNIGTGTELTIKELAEMIGRVVGYTGKIEFDPSKPDGTPRKVMDVGLINSMGWKAKIGLEEGLKSTYAWVLENKIFD